MNTPSVSEPLPKKNDLKSLTGLNYALYGAGVFFFLPSLVAIIINYIKKPDVKGTWLESHFTWQIRTFWWSMIGLLIGAVLSLVVVGIAILFVVEIWLIYRIVKGALYLRDNKAI